MKGLLVSLIRFYQKAISPAKRDRCPFIPSCSEYCFSSLEEYGPAKGLFLGAWRILRCNPFNTGNFDPPDYWGGKFKMSKTNLTKEPGYNG